MRGNGALAHALVGIGRAKPPGDSGRDGFQAELVLFRQRAVGLACLLIRFDAENPAGCDGQFDCLEAGVGEGQVVGGLNLSASSASSSSSSAR